MKPKMTFDCAPASLSGQGSSIGVAAAFRHRACESSHAYFIAFYADAARMIMLASSLPHFAASFGATPPLLHFAMLL